jgi:nicotinamidase/pyrazinamidase
MLPTGKLYVPGAEETVPAMSRLVAGAREAGIVHVASADDHELTDPEISVDPDFRNTYPPHCLRGTPGARKITETDQGNPFPFSIVPYPPGLVPELVSEHREILLLKKNFNVFTNPNTDSLLDALDPAEIVVFGVATDVCDDAAIRGFLLRGRRVRFVEDAARGLDEARVTACTDAWRAAGVGFTTADEAVDSFA